MENSIPFPILKASLTVYIQFVINRPSQNVNILVQQVKNNWSLFCTVEELQEEFKGFIKPDTLHDITGVDDLLKKILSIVQDFRQGRKITKNKIKQDDELRLDLIINTFNNLHSISI